MIIALHMKLFEEVKGLDANCFYKPIKKHSLFSYEQ